MRQATEEHSPSSSDEESEDQFYEDFLPIIRIVVAVVAVVVCVIECGIFEEPSDEPNSKLKKTKKRKRMDPQEGLVILEKLSKQIDVLIEKIKDLRGCSFPEAMEAVESLPGVEVGGELWRFATRLFKVQEERKMFSTLKKSDPDIILDWLNYRLNSDSSSS